MTDDRQIMEQVRQAVDDCTRAVDSAPSLLAPILQKAKGDPPMKKKMSAALALACALILIAASALAVTALKPDVLHWLFPGQDAPEEIQQLVQQNNNIQQSENAALTLTETLFDGEKLTVSFILKNPSGKPLVYTVGNARLDDQPLLYETAQSPYGYQARQALGGQVNGTSLPTEKAFFVTWNGTGSPSDNGQDLAPSFKKSPLKPTENAVLTLSVTVYEPLAAYIPVSEAEFRSGKYDMVSNLLPLYAEEAQLNMHSLPDSSQLKMVETLEFSFPIVMQETKITAVSAAPGDYANDLYTLHLDLFTLSHTGGKMEVSFFSPVPAFLTETSFLSVFPEDVFEQALAAKDHSLSLRLASSSCGSSIDPETDQISHFQFDADFRSNAGELPRGVYLVWLDDEQTHWHTALYIPLTPQ